MLLFRHAAFLPLLTGLFSIGIDTSSEHSFSSPQVGKKWSLYGLFKTTGECPCNREGKMECLTQRACLMVGEDEEI